MADKFLGGAVYDKTSISIAAFFRQTTNNTEKTGLVDSDITASYWRQGGSRVDIPVYALSAVDDAHSAGGFIEVDSTDARGLYRFDTPDAAFASGADWVVVVLQATGCFSYAERFNLTGDVKNTTDLIYSRVSNLSISSRVETTLPVTIIHPTSGDKFVAVDVFLSDVDGNLFDSRDSDGGNYSTNAHYTLLDRVKPTSNNAGGYFFQLTTFGSVDAGCAAPDWSTAQTPTNTVVDANGNTWTNIGLTTGTTDRHNGFGIVVSDDAGVEWDCYSDNLGAALPKINQCHHHETTALPQVVPRIATGTYRFWINVDALETARAIHFYFAWFDKARWDGYTTTDHKRQLFQMAITDAMPEPVSIIIPPLAGTVTQVYAMSAQSISVVRGDSFRLTFNLGADRTGWTPQYGMRLKGTGHHSFTTKSATWIDAALGTGYVDITAAENDAVGTLEGELQLRNGDERNTALKVTITVIDDVVKG
jgi:hypothetical protein